MIFFKILFLSLGLLLVTKSSSEEPGQRLGERRYNGLKFGPTKQDYVLFLSNMTSLQEAYSVCGWVKKIRTDGSPFWFAYGTRDDTRTIRTSDNGYFRMLNAMLDLRSKVTNLIGTWRHVCLTWSMSTRTVRGYFDGTELGSATTPSDKRVGGDGFVVLGNEFNTYGGGFDSQQAFGGELYKVNVFDKELSAGEVTDMWEGGLCSEVEEKYGRRRYLKWEDLLLKEKSGNVSEIDVSCHPEIEDNEQAGEKRSTDECDCNQGSQTISSSWDLLRGQKFLNKTVSMEMVEELKRSWDILGDFIAATITERFISHCKLYHDRRSCTDD